MAEAKSAAKKPQGASAGKAKKSGSDLLRNFLVIIVMITIAHLIFHLYFGSSANFLDEEMHTPANLLGTMYLGGWVVPFLMSTFLILMYFVFERGLTVFKAKGKVNATEFVRKVQYHLANKNIDAAIKECDKQAGSVGNVMRAGLGKYSEMINNTELDTEQKVASIQKEIEETTALELPIMEKNMVFLSTIASVATLIGLFGTVLGMIRAFAAMSTGGAPDSAALAAGISEALVNTALGIGTSAIAIIGYNFYTTIIDNITFGIDESGFTLTQNFTAQYK